MTECTHCDENGNVNDDSGRASMHHPMKVKCPFCQGTKQVQIVGRLADNQSPDHVQILFNNRDEQHGSD